MVCVSVIMSLNCGENDELQKVYWLNCNFYKYFKYIRLNLFAFLASNMYICVHYESTFCLRSHWRKFMPLCGLSRAYVRYFGMLISNNSNFSSYWICDQLFNYKKFWLDLFFDKGDRSTWKIDSITMANFLLAKTF